MQGMSSATGTAIQGLEHIQQSLADVLCTPVGTRVMRREYGSLIPELIDQPLNGAVTLQLYAAAALAISQWEPRLQLNQVRLATGQASSGTVELELDITRLDTGAPEAARVFVPMGGNP